MSIDHMARHTWHGQRAETMKQMLQHEGPHKEGRKNEKTTNQFTYVLPICFKRSFSEGDKDNSVTQILDVEFWKIVSNSQKYAFDHQPLFEQKFNKKWKLAEQMGWLEAISHRLQPKPSKIICYPVSGKGFEFLKVDLEGNSSVTPRDLMRYEWKRVESFRNFPTHVNISSLGLAKSGFYYTGNGDCVSCFSCGINHSGWQNGDDPISIHRMLSPSCLFINGVQSQNVPISEETERTSTSENQNIDSHTHDNSYTNDLQSGHGNEHRLQVDVNRITPQNGQEIDNANTIHVSENQQLEIPERQTEHDASHEGQSLPNSISGSREENGSQIYRNNIKALSQNTEREQQINQEINNYDPLGINFDRPRYPAYAVMNVRLSTFQCWPTNLTQLPRDMAIAGYIYAGYEDYVRCFFCGGGLKNWDPGDDPWIEHARWFPRCAFLRHNKGNDFVAHVQVQNSEVSNGQSSPRSPKTSDVPTSNVATCHISNHDLQSQPAFQSIVEMGYPLDVIQIAFTRLQQVKTIDQIHAEDIIDIILDNEERTSTSERELQTEEEKKNKSLSNGHVRKRSIDSLNEVLKAANIEDTSLIEENKQLKEQRRCKICLDKEANIVLLPCGHLCCCSECAPAMRKCPICRTFVKGTVKAWLV